MTNEIGIFNTYQILEVEIMTLWRTTAEGKKPDLTAMRLSSSAALALLLQLPFSYFPLPPEQRIWDARLNAPSVSCLA